MRIRTFRHRGLKLLVERDNHREIRLDMTKRVRNVLAALVMAENIRSLRPLPGWRVHELVGDRKGTWSVSVSGNWRITFEIVDSEIVNLDLEDYH
jgi:proteic killer suppression protein